MTEVPRSLPAFASFFLTKHVPCAALALAMLSSLIWLPSLFMGLPLLAIFMSFVAVLLHMLTPALFAVIFIGGGLRYALQVTAIVAFGITLISGMNLLIGVLVALLYGILPIWATKSLMSIGGISRSAIQLLFGLFTAVCMGLLFTAQSQGVDLHAMVDLLLTPMFSNMAHDVGSLPAEGLAQVQNLLSWSLPGLLVFGIWTMWWMDVIYARKFAVTYGFYRGDIASLLTLNLSKNMAYLFMVSLMVANLHLATLQYVAISLAIVLAGVFSIQGIAVVHVWLKSRDMQMVIVMMYMLLFVWSMMLIPFIILGLLDIWYDYRRNIYPTLGGK